MLSMDSPPPGLRPKPAITTGPACRLCGARLHRTLIDLGSIPLASGLDDRPYPLHVRMCDSCALVQIAENLPPELATTPARRTLACQTKAKHHAETMRRRLCLSTESLVIQIGNTDRNLLKPYQSAGIPVLGIAPAPNAGIPIEAATFSTGTAMEIAVRHGCADLVIADNVLPLVPDLFDFVAGLASILRPNGMAILQVPYLLSLVEATQFDAFSHDIYTYLTLRVLEHALRAVGLRLFDAERLPTDGGQLRVQACHTVGPHPARPGLKAVRLAERFAELDRRDFYSGFSERVSIRRTEIHDFLTTRRAAGRRVCAYGATPRGVTLLNCCGITTEEITCVADPDPARLGRVLPGSRIPIVSHEVLVTDPPDDIIILPWQNASEIALDVTPLRQRGTQLWTLIPRITRV